jgi:hypothetical protein
MQKKLFADKNTMKKVYESPTKRMENESKKHF